MDLGLTWISYTQEPKTIRRAMASASGIPTKRAAGHHRLRQRGRPLWISKGGKNFSTTSKPMKRRTRPTKIPAARPPGASNPDFGRHPRRAPVGTETPARGRYSTPTSCLEGLKRPPKVRVGTIRRPISPSSSEASGPNQANTRLAQGAGDEFRRRSSRDPRAATRPTRAARTIRAHVGRTGPLGLSSGTDLLATGGAPASERTGDDGNPSATRESRAPAGTRCNRPR